MTFAVLRWASVVIFVTASPAFGQGKLGRDCTFKGKQLWGRVQFVTSGADLKIDIVSLGADLRVMEVSSLPNACGKWQTVTAVPDLRVQIDTIAPDLKIEYVTDLPGVR